MTEHTPTPWKGFNLALENKKMHQKIGPMIIKKPISASDAKYAKAAIDYHDRLVEIAERIAGFSDPMLKTLIYDARDIISELEQQK